MISTPPKYDPEAVAQAIFIEAVEHRPLRLTVDELVMRVVSDPGDGEEVETATDALRDLRRSGLVRYRNDDRLVEVTQAGLRAHELLTAM